MENLKKILIASYDLQVGGVERSLISLLEHFDYQRYEIDLLLYDHRGDFFPYLTGKVNLLSEDSKLASIRKPITKVFKEGYTLLGISRVCAKVKAMLEPKGQESVVQMQDMWRYALPYLPRQKEDYDIAISYLWPHDYVAYKVKAKKKIAWIHTDYTKIIPSNVSDAIQPEANLKMGLMTQMSLDDDLDSWIEVILKQNKTYSVSLEDKKKALYSQGYTKEQIIDQLLKVYQGECL